MIFATALLALALHAAPASDASAAPAVHVERAAYVRSAHAALVSADGKMFANVELDVAAPAISARRTVSLVGLASDGTVLFERRVVATAGMNDARFQRAVHARARVELPEVAGLSELRVRAGR